MRIVRASLLVIGLIDVAGCSATSSGSSLPASVAPTAAFSPSLAATSTASPSLAPTTSAPASVDPAALGVVRGWLDAQNAGDLEKAATFFAPGARLGGSGLVTTHNVAEIVAVLEPLAVCHHEIVGARSMAGAIFVAVELSGPNCTFLVGGETTHEIEIPVQIADGKIICTCPPGASRQPSPGVRA
jgi:hypothetical protein